MWSLSYIDFLAIAALALLIAQLRRTWHALFNSVTESRQKRWSPHLRPFTAHHIAPRPAAPSPPIHTERITASAQPDALETSGKPASEPAKQEFGSIVALALALGLIFAIASLYEFQRKPGTNS